MRERRKDYKKSEAKKTKKFYGDKCEKFSGYWAKENERVPQNLQVTRSGNKILSYK